MATHLAQEILKNCNEYHSKLQLDILNSYSTNISNPHTIESYKRVIALGALSVGVKDSCSAESYQFFTEAQNDILCSHLLVTIGSFRAALISLRNAIENTLFFIYYKDHHVEHQLWLSGKHRLKFSHLFEYLEDHPAHTSPKMKEVCTKLRDEYSTLSKAVHGSATHFRMTNTKDFPNIVGVDKVSFSKWNSRSIAVFTSIVITIFAHFADSFSGARLTHQRDVIGEALGKHAKDFLRNELGISV